MVMPTWDGFMAPVLGELLDGQTRTRRELYVLLADRVGLTAAEREETLNSGQLKFHNRIGWATSYLNRADCLERPTRGAYRITDAGRRLLDQHPDGITEKQLRAFLGGGDATHTWHLLREMEQGAGTMTTATPEPTDLDPIEQIDAGVQRLHADVATDLLTRLHTNEPAFFEQAVLDLLMAMGYGGAEGRATRTQLTNDGGIDGIVDQDALGLSRIYVQAKRYALNATVNRPEIQGFVGALHGRGAAQGVFITTGHFTAGARQYAENLPTRIVLIDGPRLADLMIRYGVGVQIERTIHLVKIDEDFFE